MLMVLAFIKRIMGKYTKESLKNFKSMEKEKKLSQMAIVLREITHREKQLERVNTHGAME